MDSTIIFCRWPESNRHDSRHSLLRTAGLPIPPHRLNYGRSLVLFEPKGFVFVWGWFAFSIKLSLTGDVFEAKYASDKLVRKKESAITVVIFVKKVALPCEPNIVEDAPLPNAAPASAPFPC